MEIKCKRLQVIEGDLDENNNVGQTWEYDIIQFPNGGIYLGEDSSIWVSHIEEYQPIYGDTILKVIDREEECEECWDIKDIKAILNNCKNLSSKDSYNILKEIHQGKESLNATSLDNNQTLDPISSDSISIEDIYTRDLIENLLVELEKYENDVKNSINKERFKLSDSDRFNEGESYAIHHIREIIERFSPSSQESHL